MDPVTGTIIVAALTGLFGLFKGSSVKYTPASKEAREIDPNTPITDVSGIYAYGNNGYNSGSSNDGGYVQQYDATAYAQSLSKNKTVNTVSDIFSGLLTAASGTPEGQAVINQTVAKYSLTTAKNNWVWLAIIGALGGGLIYVVASNKGNKHRYNGSL